MAKTPDNSITTAKTCRPYDNSVFIINSNTVSGGYNKKSYIQRTVIYGNEF
jgi:hypothetical protein